MQKRETDSLGRPILKARESQRLAFYRLLRAAKDPDDWNGPLGAAAEIALSLNDFHLLMLLGYREDILTHREIVARGIDPGETEEDIRKEWFGPYD